MVAIQDTKSKWIYTADFYNIFKIVTCFSICRWNLYISFYVSGSSL